MRHLFRFILSITLYLLASAFAIADTAAAISVNTNYDAIGEYASYLPETDQPLSIEQAREAYSSGKFMSWNKPVLSFGIGISPVWVRFTVDNSYQHKRPTQADHRKLMAGSG